MWWRWYHWANPVAWTLYGLVVSQYGEETVELETEQTVRNFIRSYLGFRHEFIGVVAAMVAAFGVVFAFIFAFSIKTFNFQKR